jgi:predicted lipoprotein with Yx(FWY)xxD motif
MHQLRRIAIAVAVPVAAVAAIAVGAGTATSSPPNAPVVADTGGGNNQNNPPNNGGNGGGGQDTGGQVPPGGGETGGGGGNTGGGGGNTGGGQGSASPFLKVSPPPNVTLHTIPTGTVTVTKTPTMSPTKTATTTKTTTTTKTSASPSGSAKTSGSPGASGTAGTGVGASGGVNGAPLKDCTGKTVSTPLTVKVGTAGGKQALVDANGCAFYLNISDTAQQSTCTAACLAVWPPATAPGQAGSGVQQTNLGSFTRPEGGQQLTAFGHQLYYFHGDTQPGQANGQGTASMWFLVDPNGNPIQQ